MSGDHGLETHTIAISGKQFPMWVQVVEPLDQGTWKLYCMRKGMTRNQFQALLSQQSESLFTLNIIHPDTCSTWSDVASVRDLLECLRQGRGA